MNLVFRFLSMVIMVASFSLSQAAAASPAEGAAIEKLGKFLGHDLTKAKELHTFKSGLCEVESESRILGDSQSLNVRILFAKREVVLFNISTDYSRQTKASSFDHGLNVHTVASYRTNNSIGHTPGRFGSTVRVEENALGLEVLIRNQDSLQSMTCSGLRPTS